MLKFITFACLILSAFANAPVKPANGGIQNFNVGKRVAGDKLIWSGSGSQVIDFAKAITMEVQFPQEEQKNDAVISQIVATAMLDSGNSQFTITNGGVGQKNFNLRVVSNNAHKITYKFQVYGK